MRTARCFVRLAPRIVESDSVVDRPKVVLLGADTSFAAFKALCAAKLGIASSGDDITLLLGSQTGSINLHSAPEIEALDEISPDDLLIVLPRSASAAPAGTSTEGAGQPLQDEEYEVKDDRELSAAEEEEDGEEEDGDFKKTDGLPGMSYTSWARSALGVNQKLTESSIKRLKDF